MEMSTVNLDTSLPVMDLQHNIDNTKYQVDMKMINITDDTSLV